MVSVRTVSDVLSKGLCHLSFYNNNYTKQSVDVYYMQLRQ